MNFRQIDKLIEGEKYVFVVREESPDALTFIEKSYIGEFRGWADIPEWQEFVLFLIKGETAAELYHCGDLLRVEKIKQ